MSIVGLKNIRFELDNLKELPHILFIGPRGVGKTMLTKYIAKKKKLNLTFLNGSTTKKVELLNTLISINKDDIILIDEIHRLRADIEEVLYEPMSSFKLPVKMYSGTFQQLKLPHFTIVGTTTSPSSISKPLVSRFQLVIQIPHYNVRELARIIRLHYNFSRRDAIKIARNVVTPREAINLAYRVNQLPMSVDEALQFIGYKNGFSKSERTYLRLLKHMGTISLPSLSSILQLDPSEIRLIEDKILRKGLIEISSKGRRLTIKGLVEVNKLEVA